LDGVAGWRGFKGPNYRIKTGLGVSAIVAKIANGGMERQNIKLK